MMGDKVFPVPAGTFRIVGYDPLDGCCYFGGDYADKALAIASVDEMNEREKRPHSSGSRYELFDETETCIRSMKDIV